MYSKNLIAIIILLILAIIYVAFSGYKKEGFVSEKAKEICNVISKEGMPDNYTTYKNKIKDADIVQFTDVNSLYKENKLTPENVQNVI